MLHLLRLVDVVMTVLHAKVQLGQQIHLIPLAGSFSQPIFALFCTCRHNCSNSSLSRLLLLLNTYTTVLKIKWTATALTIAVLEIEMIMKVYYTLFTLVTRRVLWTRLI